MNTLKGFLIVILVGLFGTLEVLPQSEIFVDDAVIEASWVGSGQTLTLKSVGQSFAGLFAVEISASVGSEFTFSYAGIAEEYALYAVNLGMVIDPVFASATTPLVSNNGVDPGSSQQVFTLGQSKYFGYWDDRSPFVPDVGIGTPDVTDLYGWLVITRNTSGLEVTSSATALGGGILVGSFNAIPEPDITLLFSLGLGFFLFFKRFSVFESSRSQK